MLLMAKGKPTRSTALAIKHALSSARHHTPRPIVIRTPAPVVKHHKKGRKHHGGGGSLGLGGLMSKQRIGIVTGAFVVGLLEKQGLMQQLPALPFIGRTGTIGVGAYILSNGGRNRLADDVCTAALVIAAHELGSTGSVVGAAGEYHGVDYVAGW
jgi:hypothetical protein